MKKIFLLLSLSLFTLAPSQAAARRVPTEAPEHAHHDAIKAIFDAHEITDLINLPLFFSTLDIKIAEALRKTTNSAFVNTMGAVAESVNVATTIPGVMELPPEFLCDVSKKMVKAAAQIIRIVATTPTLANLEDLDAKTADALKFYDDFYRVLGPLLS